MAITTVNSEDIKVSDLQGNDVTRLFSFHGGVITYNGTEAIEVTIKCVSLGLVITNSKGGKVFKFQGLPKDFVKLSEVTPENTKWKFKE